MKVTFKLYATLAPWLPRDARKNAVEVEIDDGMTISRILDSFNVPREMCHLVLVNGFYVAPDDRDQYRLADGDTIATWPPIAGG